MNVGEISKTKLKCQLKSSTMGIAPIFNDVNL